MYIFVQNAYFFYMANRIGQILQGILDRINKPRKAIASDMGVSVRQIQRLLAADSVSPSRS